MLGGFGRALVLSIVLALVAGVSAAAASPRPDLTVTKVSVTTTSVVSGGKASLADRVRNAGQAAGKSSRLAYYLSTDARKDASDKPLGGHVVKALKRGRTASGSSVVVVPAAAGLFRVLACADAKRQVRESSERNNCRASASFTIAAPAPGTPPGAVQPDGAGGGGTPPADGSGSSAPTPTAEACNGADDDLDGTVDEGVCTLAVTVTGGNGGTVTSNPAGISCPGTCTARFVPSGSKVTLVAQGPLVAWGGDCSGYLSTCELTAGDHTVTAEFGPDSDGDGIADAVDCAPATKNPSWAEVDTCYRQATIYELTTGAVSSPAYVYVPDAIITAVAGSVVWVAHKSGDPAYSGAQWSGIRVDLSGLSNPPAVAVGDRVLIGARASTTVLDARHLEVTASNGEAVPPPVVVSDAEFAGNSTAYNGVLVQISNAVIEKVGPSGNWALAGTGFRVRRTIIGTLPATAAGQSYASITGIGDTVENLAIGVLPRSGADIVPGP